MIKAQGLDSAFALLTGAARTAIIGSLLSRYSESYYLLQQLNMSPICLTTYLREYSE